jgi:hypothetical protein
MRSDPSCGSLGERVHGRVRERVPRGERRVPSRRRALAIASFIAVAVLGTSPSRARAADASEHRSQTWVAGFVHNPIFGQAWLWSDLHLRFYDSFEPTAILVRPGFSWRVRKPLFLTVGYAWTPSFAQPPEPREWGDIDLVDEHRAWQQLLWTPSDDDTGAAAQVRLRLEQRFRPADGGGTGLRLRGLVRGQVPITRGAPDGRDWIFVVWNETFVALDDAGWGQTRGFDQNRLFVGLGWHVKPKIVRLELGYTNQWLARPGADPVNHIVALNAFFGWPG